MPASVKYIAVIIIALVASTLIFSMMLPTGGRRASSSITQAEMRNIDQLYHEANAMAKHDVFLRNAVPSLSRVGNHSLSCRSAHGENCTCNGGAYTFSDVADLEAQLLRPGNTDGVRHIKKLNPETSTGLEIFKRVCDTPNASEALDAAFSVGAATPGQSQGTGNMFWGENGRFSRTFKYWRSVLTASLNLIPRLIGTIKSLFERLCASEAREAAAEARAVAAETSLKMLQQHNMSYTEDQAQLANARKAYAQQLEQHANEKAALWQGLREAQEELFTLKANHLRTLQALGVRRVNGTQDLYAGYAANEARMAEKIRTLEAGRAASMVLLKVAETAAKAELRAYEQALQESTRLLEGTSQR